MKQKKRILLTGITGFIGSHMARQLVDRGDEVIGIVKPSTSRNMKELSPIIKGAKLLNVDITEYPSVKKVISDYKPDVVVHVAALSHVSESFDNPFSYVNVNINGTMNIAHAIINQNDKNMRMIFASTAEVYGIHPVSEMPMKETLELRPSSPYSVTKMCMDVYLRLLNKTYGLNATIMRCTNTYGRKLDASFLVEYLISAMLRDQDIYIGAPNSIRDYMYVNDHVGAYLSVIDSNEKGGEVFNFGTGIGITNKELAEEIAGIVGYKKKLNLGKYPPGYPNRPIVSDQPAIVLDAIKARAKLGWTPKYTLDQGLKLTHEYWKNKLNI